jgi:hypothetical protein
VRGCDYWLEEVGGLEGQGLEVEVPDEVFEDAELLQVSVSKEATFAGGGEGSNVHARQKVNS